MLFITLCHFQLRVRIPFCSLFTQDLTASSLSTTDRTAPCVPSTRGAREGQVQHLVNPARESQIRNKGTATDAAQCLPPGNDSPKLIKI